MKRDPEVQADAELRDDSEHDKTRSGVPSWKPPAIVEHWPCRTCGDAVPVTQDGIEAAHVWDQILTARGEPPIDRQRTMFCVACVIKHKANATERRAHEKAELAEVIRLLKQSRSPSREHDLHLRLKALGHPDIEGLIRTLCEAREPKSKGPSMSKGGV